MNSLRIFQGVLKSHLKVLTADRVLLKCQYSSSHQRTFSSSAVKKENTLLKQVIDQINITGPLTVYQYMKTVLTHPLAGYYMTRDVFGEKGDFTTSPEISQMFGELMGIWVVSEWRKMGAETPLHLVEFGPGRGTLMKDVLRVLHKFGLSESNLHVHLVEVSPYLKEKQMATLCHEDCIEKSFIQCPISWHRDITSLPEGFTMFIAHEFFDALPVHKLVKVDKEWREVLIDTNEEKNKSSPDESVNNSALINSSVKNTQLNTQCTSSDKSEDLPLRFVVSRSATPASKLFTQTESDREELEVSPDSSLVLQAVSDRITQTGGAMLLVDYGHNGTKGDTFRAFKGHSQTHPLSSPGESDLTCDVDFSLLRATLPQSVMSFGPLNQGTFLKNMGIELRLMRLMQSSGSQKERENVISGYNKLIGEMGSAFKVMAIYPSVMKNILTHHPPSGFYRDGGLDRDGGEVGDMMRRKMGVEEVKKGVEEGKSEGK